MRVAIGIVLSLWLAGCQMGLPFGKSAAPDATPASAGAPVAGVTAAPGAITGGAVTASPIAAKPGVASAAPAPRTPAAQAAAPAAAGPSIPAGTIPAKGAPAPAQAAKPDQAAPKAAPVEPEAPVSTEPKSELQIKCEKARGTWRDAAGSGVKSCVFVTRDGGKSCRKETDCDGACLARSGTCSPIKPLFGCNDILQADGRQVTLCID